jgi:hypothetical protein
MNKYLLFGAAAFFIYLRAWGNKLGVSSSTPVTDGSSSTDPSKTVEQRDIQILPAQSEFYIDNDIVDRSRDPDRVYIS